MVFFYPFSLFPAPGTKARYQQRQLFTPTQQPATKPQTSPSSWRDQDEPPLGLSQLHPIALNPTVKLQELASASLPLFSPPTEENSNPPKGLFFWGNFPHTDTSQAGDPAESNQQPRTHHRMEENNQTPNIPKMKKATYHRSLSYPIALRLPLLLLPWSHIPPPVLPQDWLFPVQPPRYLQLLLYNGHLDAPGGGWMVMPSLPSCPAHLSHPPPPYFYALPILALPVARPFMGDASLHPHNIL